MTKITVGLDIGFSSIKVVALERGSVNNINCKINLKETRDIRIKVDRIYFIKEGIDLDSWVIGGINNVWERNIPAASDVLYKIGQIDVPDDADLSQVRAELVAEKKSSTGSWTPLTGSPDLDFEIKKSGAIRTALC